MIPDNYEAWKFCITRLCRIPLTPAFIDARLAALSDLTSYETQKFVSQWGEKHRAQVCRWFQEAHAELRAAGA